MMMRRWLSVSALLAVCAAGFLTVAARADEGEKKVTLEQVPAAVRATIEKCAQGGTLKEIEQQTEHGTTIYEIEVLMGDRKVEFKIAADGKLLGRDTEADEQDDEGEQEIQLDQVPAAARKALLEQAGGEKIAKVVQEREDEVTLYEGTWEVKGTAHEAKVMADGTLVECEESVELSALPESLRKELAEHFPKGAELKIEKKMIVVYEIVAKVDGRKHEVLLSPTGERVRNGEEDGEKHHADKDRHEERDDEEGDND